jgi:riboflavin kinase/FMN adenylyltransferase
MSPGSQSRSSLMAEQGFSDLNAGSVLTVGTFDGVHLGHRAILTELETHSARTGLPAVIVTFAPHPLAVVNPTAAPRLLTPGSERLAEFASAGGPDHAVVIPFSTALASLSAESFVSLLVGRYSMQALVVGYDHGMGRGRHGDVDALKTLGGRFGFSVHVVAARTDDRGIVISSTAVRRAVAYGELELARALLGRRYGIVGTVVRGSSRGRSIGIPTINLSVPAEKLLPPDGVYAVRVSAAKGAFGGMMNLGGRPTFGETNRVPEIHMFDGSGDWYGDTVRVEFVSRLRDTIRFSGVKELSEQLSRDAESARVALTQA